MPIKNQLPTLSELYSIYEEVPEELLDEADIDSYLYRSILNTKNIASFVSAKHRTKNPSTLKILNSTAPQYNKSIP